MRISAIINFGINLLISMLVFLLSPVSLIEWIFYSVKKYSHQKFQIEIFGVFDNGYLVIK